MHDGDVWRRLSPTQTQARIARFQRTMIWAGLRVWMARCRAMDAWFGEQKYYRDALARDLAASHHKRVAARQAGTSPRVRTNPRPERSKDVKTRRTGLDFLVTDREAAVVGVEAEAFERRVGEISLRWY